MESNPNPYPVDKDAGGRDHHQHSWGLGGKSFHLPKPDSSMTLKWWDIVSSGLFAKTNFNSTSWMAVWGQEEEITGVKRENPDIRKLGSVRQRELWSWEGQKCPCVAQLLCTWKYLNKYLGVKETAFSVSFIGCPCSVWSSDAIILQASKHRILVSHLGVMDPPWRTWFPHQEKSHKQLCDNADHNCREFKTLGLYTLASWSYSRIFYTLCSLIQNFPQTSAFCKPRHPPPSTQ